MSEKQVKTKKPKKKLSKSAIVLISGLVIIAIPCLILGGILIYSAINTGTPILGERFAGDLDPAITDENLATIKANVEALEGVEAVEVTLPTGQLRVNIDTNDDMSKEDMKALVETAYEKVIETLPVDTYFTSSESRRMYDLSINVYNSLDDDENLIYYELTKNAMMEKPSTQLVSEPLDPELVDALNEAQNPQSEEKSDAQNESE